MRVIHRKADVAVLGGGPGGLPAAIAAARHGARVILAERNGHLGGNAAMGLPLLGFLAQDGRQIIGGIAQEFVTELQREGYSFGHSRCPMHNSVTLVHPEMFRILALKKCREAGVELLLHTEVTDAVVSEGRLRQVTVTGKGMQVVISADVFIDATGDGDLAEICGARWEKGDEERGIVQPPTLMFSLIHFDEERFFQFLETHPENLRQLDTVKVGEGYDTGLFRRTPNHVFVGLQALLRELRERTDCPILRENIIYITSTIPGKIYINTVRVPGCDGSELDSLTRGEIEGHLQIPGIVALLREHVPGFENCVLDSISPAIGIRETRRFDGLRRLTIGSVLSGNVPEDTIALGGYKVDIHSGEGEGTILKCVEKPYGIPMGCIISRDIDGLLLSGRCISMDHEALGSERVMPTCMAVGQAAGVLASEASAQGLSPRNVDYREVCKLLTAEGAILR